MDQHNLYIPKTPLLKDAIHGFWQTSRKTEIVREETIIPNGIIEIIFNFNETDDFKAHLSGQSFQLPKCFINGYNTKPIQLQLPNNQNSFGIGLNPTAIEKIWGIPASEFANKCINMIWIDTSINALWHRLAEQPTFNDRVRIFSDWIVKRLPHTTKQEKAIDHFLAAKIGRTFSVSELSELLCYSPRHLSRKFHALTGMNTEETLLYKKYIQAINLIHHSELSLTEIAYTCDFVDQSHFSKTFKSFSLYTPKEYKKVKSHIVGHILEHVR
jgi:AraC-like DNA-binding protein